MPTTTFPPILIWQPGGGTPVGPVSNPPVYSQSDITQLVIGQAYVDVVFGSVQTDNSWVLVECDVVNTMDLSPLNIWPGLITNRTTAGFRVWLNGMPDSNNYYLHWAVSGVNIPAIPATSYLFTGPTSGLFGVDAIFTVKLPPSTTATGLVITPSDGGAGGTFSPPSVTLSTGSFLATFIYHAAGYGTATISVTNNHNLTDPGSIAFTSIAPIYTFTGPSTGNVGVASTNFTVLLAGDAVLAVPTTITPHDGGAGGTFAPTTVLLVAGVPVHFTYTPASTGAKTISVTNNGGLADPANLTYTATAAVHLLNTLISYWKLDEALGVARADSVGSMNLSDPLAGCLSFAAIIGNGADFPGTGVGGPYLTHVDVSTLDVTSDFTFSFWVRIDTQVDEWLMMKGTGAAIDYGFGYFVSGASGFVFRAGGSTGYATTQVGATIPTTGVWHHLVGWFDSGDSKLRIRVDDATTYTSPTTTTLTQHSGPLVLGGLWTGGGFANQLNGMLDEMGFWKRKLTSAEITALYNGGSGLPFSSFTT